MLETVHAVNKEVFSGWFRGLKAEKVLYAVNCGADEEV